ncbi:MAG: hypothetical protein M1825_002615 [Sarcosagium campestre]|nr:MAG: hypothetical protein M1825_002615 [Sarcosagium campestre]
MSLFRRSRSKSIIVIGEDDSENEAITSPKITRVDQRRPHPGPTNDRAAPRSQYTTPRDSNIRSLQQDRSLGDHEIIVVPDEDEVFRESQPTRRAGRDTPDVRNYLVGNSKTTSDKGQSGSHIIIPDDIQTPSQNAPVLSQKVGWSSSSGISIETSGRVKRHRSKETGRNKAPDLKQASKEMYCRQSMDRNQRPIGGIVLHLPDDRSSHPNFFEVRVHRYNDLTLKAHDTVELKNGDFLRISRIVKDVTLQEIYLIGWLFRRTRALPGTIARNKNEVVWILSLVKERNHPHCQHDMSFASVHEVIRLRQLILTNTPYPRLSFKGNADTADDPETQAQLVCRFKWLQFYEDDQAMSQDRSCEEALVRLRHDEPLEGTYDDDEHLRKVWRGHTIKGGDFEGESALVVHPSEGEGIIDLTSANDDVSTSNAEPSASSIGGGVDYGHQPSGSENLLPNFFGRLDSEHNDYSKIETIDLTGDSEPRPSPKLSNRSKYQATCEDDSEEQRALRDSAPTHVDSEAVFTATLASVTHQAEFSRTTSSSRKTSRENQAPTVPEIVRDSPTSSRNTPHPNMTIKRRSTPNETCESTQGRRRAAAGRVVRDRSSFPMTPLRPDQRLAAGRRYARISKKPMTKPRTYTYGDCFCGCGGSASGAQQAGLRVCWGFDSNPDAINSFHRNFNVHTDCILADASQFAELKCEDHKVDIMHMSPPCQFFSPAHTVIGKDDEKNTASLFACGPLIRKARPRIVTLEQTMGLIQETHSAYFYSLVRMFTDLGYSVRWRVLNLAEYGLPQERRRLFMIASCLGESLIDFPSPSHSRDGLVPFVTVNEAIGNIPYDAENHQKIPFTDMRPPYNGNMPLPRLITTSGGGNYHPSGTRDLTLREYACLQGFPVLHRFSQSYVRKQIGNAVPPVAAKVIFDHIRQSLEKTDGGTDAI